MDFPARPPQTCETPAGLLPALGLKTALVMKSRDYLVVVDQAAQVRALQPILPTLQELISGSAERSLPLPARVKWITCADYLLRQCGINEDPATGSIHCTLAPYWAGRLGRVSCVRNNSARAVEPCRAQSRAIS